MRHSHRKRTLHIGLLMSIIFFILSWGVFADDEGIDIIKRISGNFGTPHTLGTFSPDGNAGIVTFPTDIQETSISELGVYLYPDETMNTLSGKFFIETAGWAYFGVGGQSVNVLAPLGNTGNVLDPWRVEGYAWSDNAGWITLDALSASYSGIYYLPRSQSFTGYAWSENLGFISFASSSGLTIGGKVKILGNIGGNKSYDVLYALGNKFNSVSFGPFLNNIRKNVALLTRSVPTTDRINVTDIANRTSIAKLNTNTVFYSVDETPNQYITMGSDGNNILSAKEARSLIIEGADLYIDGDVTESPLVKSPRAIIVLKKNNQGGNVYIRGSVKKIHASIIAEGTVYSGYPLAGSHYLYNDTKEKVTNLPANQLHVFGTIISRNTIGGSETDEITLGACPNSVEVICDRNTAIRYDLGYFRTYDGTDARRAFRDSSLDDYSLIVEYNPAIIGDPPPGLTQ